jgi:hypothetical protein
MNFDNRFLLSLKPASSPSGRLGSPAVEARKQQLLGLWSQHVAPVSADGDSDFEDFYEQAARLEAAIDAVGVAGLWVDVHDGHPRHLGTGATRPYAEVANLPRFGSQPQQHDFVPSLAVERMADSYATLTTFQTMAGRRIILAGVDAGGPEVTESLLDVAALHPDGRVLVKVNRQKYGIYDFIVKPGSTLDEVFRSTPEDLDGALMHLEGWPDAFIVQEFMPMEYEYRMFVVDGVPVTGAGCVEEFTPLENSAPFDTKVRRSRSAVSAVEDRPDVVARLLTFAVEAAATLLIEKPELTHYALDVALDSAGNPLIVELNALLNSGLYASDPRIMYRALIG